MRGVLLSSALLFLVTGGVAAEKEKLKSGLQVGDRAGAFNVLDVTGPNKGKKLCYR